MGCVSYQASQITAGRRVGSAFTAARSVAVHRRSSAKAAGESRSQTQSQWSETKPPRATSGASPTPPRLRWTTPTCSGPSTRREPSKARGRFRPVATSPEATPTRPQRIRQRSITVRGAARRHTGAEHPQPWIEDEDVEAVLADPSQGTAPGTSRVRFSSYLESSSQILLR